MQIPYLQSSHFLTRADLRTLGLASIGGALEFYDFIIYGGLGSDEPLSKILKAKHLYR